MFDFVLFNFLHSTLHIIALHFAPARLRAFYKVTFSPPLLASQRENVGLFF